MARFGIQGEDKLLVLKYTNILSPYIQEEMDFLTVSMLVNAFHYVIKLEAKYKGKSHFANKPTSRTPDNKSPTDFDKFKNPSQPTP